MQQTADLWAAAVGAFLPLLIAALIRGRWSSEAKQLSAFGLCVLAAAGTAWFTGEFNAGGVARAVLVVAVAAHSLYAQWWKPTGIAPAIERLTDGAQGEAR